jgi:diguanylate cyclase (GGDEF)-like protein
MYKEVFIVTLLITTCLNGMLALNACRQHHKTSATASACLLLAATAYTFGYAFELASTTLSGILFWVKVEYLGISTFPAFWIITAIQYSGRDRWLTRPVLTALFVIPVITLILNYTNNYHHLYYRAVSMFMDGPFPLLSITRGPWYWVHTAFINLSLLYGNILFLRMWRYAAPPYRRQIAIILTGSLIPWINYFIYLAGKSPWGLDLSPLSLSFTAIIFTWGLFRYQLINLAPVARDMVFESMRDGVLVLDAENRIVDFNPSARSILKSLSLSDVGHPAEEVFQSYPDLLKLLSSDTQKQIELQIAQEEKFCHYNLRLSFVRNRRHQLIGKTIVFNDITAQVLMLDKLKTLATTDYLTNIFNRGYFLDLSQLKISQDAQEQQPVSVILIDIDNFKQINDTHGHKAGDLTLKAVVEVCNNNLRTADLFGRYGGEEFAIFLPETTPETAFKIAERLRKKIASIVVPLDNTEITVTASFGAAGVEQTANISLNELLKKADRALYSAKKAGRNRVVLAEPEM